MTIPPPLPRRSPRSSLTARGHAPAKNKATNTWFTPRRTQAGVKLSSPCQACGADSSVLCAPDCPDALDEIRRLHGLIAAIRRPCAMCGRQDVCVDDVLTVGGIPGPITDAGLVALRVYESLTTDYPDVAEDV